MRGSSEAGNSHYEYINANPKGLRTGDCVIRAIAVASGKSWDEVFMALVEYALKKKCMPNNTSAYQKWLADNGWTKQRQPRRQDNRRYTLTEFCTQIASPDQVYIVHVQKHLTCVRGRKIHDTWDCGGYCVGNYWTI